MHPSASQKRAGIVVCGVGILFGFLFLGHALWCHSVLCSSSKCSQLLSLVIMLWGNSSPLIAFCILLHQLWGSIFLAEFNAPVREWGMQQTKTFWYPKLSTISWTTWCLIPVSTAIALTVVSTPSGELTNFSFFLSARKVHTGNKRRVDWQCLCSHFQEVFTHGLTLPAPMQLSPYACWSFVWICGRGIFSLTKNSITSCCYLTNFMCQLSWNLGASTSWNPRGLSRPVMGLLLLHVAGTTCLCQPFSCTEIWCCDRGRQCDFHSGVTGEMEPVITYCALQYWLAFVHNSKMLMMFCTICILQCDLFEQNFGTEV